MNILFSQSSFGSASKFSVSIPFSMRPEVFHNVSGSSVMFDAHMFNESPLDIKKCCVTLTKLLYCVYCDFKIDENEATSIFFSITKAFQSNDRYLRRLLHLSIKELSILVKESIMVTSSLTQDINSQLDSFTRCSAIRAIFSITNQSTISGLEKAIKQCILDTKSNISSTAIVSCILLCSDNKETINRWISYDIDLRSGILRYHIMGLLFLLREDNKLATLKLLQRFVDDLLLGINNGTIYHFEASDGPYICLTLRIYLKCVKSDPEFIKKMPGLPWKILTKFSSENDAILLEIAKTIIEIHMLNHFSFPLIGEADLSCAISILQSFLNSNKHVGQFSALRILRRLCDLKPGEVSLCNSDIESILSSSHGGTHRSIITLAITILLKTNSEVNISKLIEQISNHMAGLSDNLKIGIVRSISQLCSRYPSVTKEVFGFLGEGLRNEGSLEYKRSIVKSIEQMSRGSEICKSLSIDILCEFIEDCEYSEIISTIIHFLSNEGNEKGQINRIRYIFNRFLLESSSVRLMAIGSLTKLAINKPEIRETVRFLLGKSLYNETDNDIKDRLLLFFRIIDDKSLCSILVKEEIYSLEEIENKLELYLNDSDKTEPFDASSYSVTEKNICEEVMESSNDDVERYAASINAVQETVSKTPDICGYDRFCEWLDSDSKTRNLVGNILHYSKESDLSEPETEYQVRYCKYVFSKHIVFQFCCKNTISGFILKNVFVSLDFNREMDVLLKYVKSTCIDSLGICEGSEDEGQEYCYVVYEYALNENRSDIPIPPYGQFASTLHFTVNEVGSGSEHEYSDEYMLKNSEILVSDYNIPLQIDAGEFERRWEDSTNIEIAEIFDLTAVQSIDEAIENITDLFGGYNSSVGGDTVYVSGMWLGKTANYVRCSFRSANEGVSLELTVRSPSEKLCELFIDAI